MKNPTPIIKVLSTKENKDGSLGIEIEYFQDWVDKVKVELGKDRVTKKDIKNYFINILKITANGKRTK